MKRRIIAVSSIMLVFVFISVALLAGLVSAAPSLYSTNNTYSGTAPKYVFMFIGDGMSTPQINAAQMYLGNMDSPDTPAIKTLDFTRFPGVGSADTYDAESFIPDSASTGTALASGVKTFGGIINMDPAKKVSYEPISKKLKKAGYKVGIVTTVTLDHATPAVFYASEPSRGNYYNLASQLVTSGFDYFGGGYFLDPDGKKASVKNPVNILEQAKKNGYKVAATKADILSLDNKSGKVLALDPAAAQASNDSYAMPYELDRKSDQLSLADFVKKGIEVLDNPNGYFMMVEGGKIDWACHANDAAAAIHDTIALNDAVKEALKVYEKHPDETLIIVTGDHETGGMSIGFAGTEYSTFFEKLEKQSKSYVEFDKIVAEYKEKTKAADAKLEDLLPQIKTSYGLIAPTDPEAKSFPELVLNDFEMVKLRDALRKSMSASKVTSTETDYLLYGTYEPLTVTCNHILDNKAGISFATYSHSGLAVPVYAIGAGYELFYGAYDDTDINKKLAAITKVK
ncbi:alkaline phosphatase [Ruminiclostridium cellobioparum]|jgi:alkaline phosphatase|uniref:alkaline phosphatase n=1 Tax=Ruminiclostridium cellobioparum TaxID=29355 RepID=UPI00048972E8|nr:alkaline phosphatase [Ruminiclostridium cellobioparum]